MVWGVVITACWCLCGGGGLAERRQGFGSTNTLDFCHFSGTRDAGFSGAFRAIEGVLEHPLLTGGVTKKSEHAVFRAFWQNLPPENGKSRDKKLSRNSL